MKEKGKVKGRLSWLWLGKEKRRETKKKKRED